VAVFSIRELASSLHRISTVKMTTDAERRRAARSDRRKHSRSGRRAGDPHTSWRRLAWLFAAYAALLSLRSVPASIRRLWRKTAA
jgi:hypothetical protein